MILFAVVSGLLICYFILTMNTKPSMLSEFLFGRHEYQVYEVADLDTVSINQNQKAK